jgi:hypothetical protein
MILQSSSLPSHDFCEDPFPMPERQRYKERLGSMQDIELKCELSNLQTFGTGGILDTKSASAGAISASTATAAFNCLVQRILVREELERRQGQHRHIMINLNLPPSPALPQL